MKTVALDPRTMFLSIVLLDICMINSMGIIAAYDSEKHSAGIKAVWANYFIGRGKQIVSC